MSRLYSIFCVVIVFILFSCSSHKKADKYSGYISLINYVESNYENEIYIYKYVWDNNYYISQNNNQMDEELADNELKKYMEEYDIYSIEVSPSEHILVEIDTRAFIQKRKFIKKYLSEEVVDAEGQLIAEKTYFYRRKPNTY